MMNPRIAGAAALAAILLAAPVRAEQPPMPGPEAGESPAASEQPASQGSVARATFALEVIDREPTEAIRRLGNDHDRVYFFTEVHRFQGQELVHRWEFGGEVVAEVPFGIDGPRWRVYSSKALDPASLGTWTVSVVDAAGTVIDQRSFDYVAASQPGPAAAQPGPEMTETRPSAAQPGPAALDE